ncbi:hypothetical protein [Xanthomonas citri]|uniref:hypothetical protein n=1 Tax=Xanthomonas citri TaxID=346 RepID=UPI0009C39CEE|nr:hypothetical protein [Xanthomonas citri]AMV02101.1 hypothetical protein TP50_06305 [Xanthomonas citri pv. aurantifolii]MCC8492166.1 hypothetical protein [Xanthomonas citri pv. fuscans]TBW92963.1 hypothetical protein TP49_23705 [Xanthomonas citri pv. aurantifolii]TBX02626.1 hypothetical protein TP46_15405 [Xanthomonas citri pv. aurantifolii]
MDSETREMIRGITKLQDSLSDQLGGLKMVVLALVQSHPNIPEFEKSIKSLIKYLESKNDADLSRMIESIKLFVPDGGEEQ